jgi:predicted Zn-dependent protease
LLLLLLVFLSGAVAPPEVRGITVQEEVELGEEFMQYANQAYRLVEDPYVCQYINALGQKLLEQFPPQPFEFHFYVVKQDVYNAFAGPAGNIFINSGLLTAMDNESELAGIIGHEISHVVCRHISEGLERAGKIQMGTLAGVMAGILLGATGSGTASEAMIVSSMAAGQSVYLTHSREAEREADELGAKALMSAGYEVQGLVTMLKKIKARDWYGDDIPSYLGTHPGAEERIVYLSRFLDFSEDKAEAAAGRDESDFKLAHARVLAFYGDSKKASAWFDAKAKKEPENHIPDYGLGMLALRENRFEEAIIYLQKVLEKRALDPLVLADLGQSYYMNGEYEAALGLLKPAVRMDTGNYDGRLFLGRTQLALEDYPGARNTFQRLYSDQPDYSHALYYLGEACSKQGKTAEAHYYLGLYYLRVDDTRKATFNLQRARTETEDGKLLARIDDALKQAEEKEKKEKKEKEKKKKEEEQEDSGGDQ